MEIKMNKEIRDYQESMFFGLNFRQFFCSLLAVLTAVGIYFGIQGRWKYKAELYSLHCLVERMHLYCNAKVSPPHSLLQVQCSYLQF